MEGCNSLESFTLRTPSKEHLGQGIIRMTTKAWKPHKHAHVLQSDYDTNVGYMDGQYQAVIRRTGALPAEQAEQLRSLESKARKWAKKFLHKVKQAATKAEAQGGAEAAAGVQRQRLSEDARGGGGRPTKGTPLDTIDSVSVPSPRTDASATLSKQSPHVASPRRMSKTASARAGGAANGAEGQLSSRGPGGAWAAGARSHHVEAGAAVDTAAADEQLRRAASLRRQQQQQQLQEQQLAEARQAVSGAERQRMSEEHARHEQLQHLQQQEMQQRHRRTDESARSSSVRSHLLLL